MYYRPKRTLLQYISSLRSVVNDLRSCLTSIFDYEGGFPQTPSESSFRSAALHSREASNLYLMFNLKFARLNLTRKLFPCGDGRKLPFSHSPSLNPSKYDTPQKTQSFKQNCKIFTNGQKVSTILAEWIKSVHSYVNRL